MAKHNEIGKTGEHIAKTFLMKQGFIVLQQNYRTRYGEIDIIAEKDKVLRFVEVKSIKVIDLNGTHLERVQPEDNLTYAKWQKIVISVETYLKRHDVPHETHYQVDLACVYIQTELRQARVKLLENIHKER